MVLPFDQAGILEDTQVFGDGRKRNGERFSQIGDATFGPSQKIEDPASGRIGQGSEDGVERWAVRMFNHMVKYSPVAISASRILSLAVRPRIAPERVRLRITFLFAREGPAGNYYHRAIAVAHTSCPSQWPTSLARLSAWSSSSFFIWSGFKIFAA